ncbi:MAG: TIGR00730 family Rossman fold protein [Deltaproteobacteria bacterium]|nr:TIGR00730 family Rossman fold protein [Deltaproteobacteria bacterium]
MASFRRLCVFCGSSDGVDPIYAEAAIAIGKLLAARGIGVVYGGAKIGLMGALANAVLVGGGEVLGVIPERLRGREIAHEGLTDLFVVESMHARKTMMAHLSDGFIALPGGWGTLEELFEVLTWTQLGYHEKPVGLLNVGGFFDGLLAYLDHTVTQGFLTPQNRRLLISAGDPEVLLKGLENMQIPAATRWIDRP